MNAIFKIIINKAISKIIKGEFSIFKMARREYFSDYLYI